MARSQDSWSGVSLRVPKWPHLLSDYSIEPYKIGWFSFVWLDLVSPIP
jgi:hypothetical protein